MATARRASRPEALPPETRTVGQLVAETLRLYGRRFWRALPLGLSIAMLGQGPLGFSRVEWIGIFTASGAVLLTASYVGASAIAADARLTSRSAATAFAAGAIVFVPFPALTTAFVLPGLAWLAFVGLAVPVAVIERAGLRASLRRATELSRADYVHALGSLATLTILYVLTRLMLVLLLRGTGDQTERIAVFLADLVLSPILFLGSALLYFDQAARASVRPGSSRAKARR
jgi:hypothetical protein